MEDRLCGVLRNKMKESFCWDCQSVLCSYCLEEHSRVRHKVFRLTSNSLVAVVGDGPQSAQGRESEKEPEGQTVQLPGTLFEQAPAPAKPAEKAPEEKKKSEPPPSVCALCGASEGAGHNMVMLLCTHSIHRECFKQYLPWYSVGS